MEDAPSPMTLTPKEEIKESFEIKQEEKNYKLNIEIINQEIILNVLDEKDLMKEYEIKLTFDELKDFHKIFLTLNSSQDFIDFIKATIENKKILIKKYKDNQITIELMVEHLFKQNIIKFDLIKKKMNLELIIQDLYQKMEKIETCKNFEMNSKKKVTEGGKTFGGENTKMKEDINNLKEDNKKIKEDNEIMKEGNKKMREDIDKLKEENKIIKQENEKLITENFQIKENIKYINNENINLINKVNNLEKIINSFKNYLITLNTNKNSISIDSAIMEKNELEMVKSAIEQKMNKKIKEIKK